MIFKYPKINYKQDPTVGVVGWLDEAGLNAGGAAVCTTDPHPLRSTKGYFGGNPTAEALASAVVSGKGSIVGILLEDSGLGYISTICNIQ